MSALTAKQRKQIPKKKFGLPSKAPGPGSYPMNDKKHAVLAKAYASRFATPEEKAKIDTKANKVIGRNSKVEERLKKRIGK